MLSAIQLEDQRRAALRLEQVNRSRAELIEASKARCKTFLGFVREAWHVLEPKAQYVHGMQIEAICEHLEAVTNHQINRLLMNVPPGAMKSLLTSVFFQAWEWGPMNLASNRFVSTAFNDIPVKRDSRKCRNLILSDWYMERWPHVILTRAGETSFENTQTGFREGVPFGSLTSQRGDRLIIDDPQSVKTAESKLMLPQTTLLFREGALNRLNDQVLSAMIIIMQRLAENDISQAALDVVEGIVHVMIPMEFEKARACITAIGWKDWRTVEGELMEPLRFPQEVVDALKKGMGAHAFAGQYQQRPTAREGGMFQRVWFDNKILDVMPAGMSRAVRSYDFAATDETAGTEPAYTASIKIETDGQIFVISHAKDYRKSPGQVHDDVKQTAGRDGPLVHIAIPEDPGQAGKDQVRTYAAENPGNVLKGIPVSGEKTVKADPLASQIEAGNVYLLKGPWNERFIDQCCAFPKGFIDMVDAAAQGYNYLTGAHQPSFFDMQKFLVRGYPVPAPERLDAVFAVLVSDVKSGKDIETAGVVYFGKKDVGGWPLTILDWSVSPVTGGVLDTWFTSIFSRVRELGEVLRAEPLGCFISPKGVGSVLLSQANRRMLPAEPIDEELAKLGINERAVNASTYIDREMVKISATAFHKLMWSGTQNRNHLLDEIAVFRIDEKENSKAALDLLSCVLFGLALNFGNAEGR